MAGGNEASGGKVRGVAILCASIALIAAGAGGAFSALSADHAAMAELALGLVAIFGIYFGIRLVTKWRAVIVILLVPFVCVAAIGIGHVASKNGGADAIASLIGPRSLSNDGAETDNPFNGRNERNTSVEDLDALMEEW